MWSSRPRNVAHRFTVRLIAGRVARPAVRDVQPEASSDLQRNYGTAYCTPYNDFWYAYTSHVDSEMDVYAEALTGSLAQLNGYARFRVYGQIGIDMDPDAVAYDFGIITFNTSVMNSRDLWNGCRLEASSGNP